MGSPLYIRFMTLNSQLFRNGITNTTSVYQVSYRSNSLLYLLYVTDREKGEVNERWKF